MIIDFHTHIFPKDICKNREKYFPGESAFKLLYDSPKAKLVDAKELVETMDTQGIDRSVIFGFPWKNPELSGKQNDYIMESVEMYPDRLIGFCCLDPFGREAGQELERCLKGGLSGLGELAFYESGIDPASLDRLAPLMEICRDFDVPVLIHTNEPVGHTYPGKSPNTLMQIYTLVKRFSENKIVLAHWGGGIFLYSLLKKEVKESLKNVWYDTAASPFLYDPDIWLYARNLAGLDKILFGTDFPLLKPDRYFKELENSGLAKKDISAICGENAARLLKIAV
ncbi:MAG: amidohydrolase [Deltaproteobacteria bacterium]|nr:amidohydrolase [Deltaproteobacteria bacterium]